MKEFVPVARIYKHKEFKTGEYVRKKDGVVSTYKASRRVADIRGLRNNIEEHLLSFGK